MYILYFSNYIYILICLHQIIQKMKFYDLHNNQEFIRESLEKSNKLTPEKNIYVDDSNS